MVQQKMHFLAVLICSLAIACYSSAQQASATTIFGLTSIPNPSTITTASAYTTSSTIFLPSALFNPAPSPQIFTGQVTTSNSTTYYSLTYDLGLSFFNPSNVPHTVADFGNQYVFSASAAGTNYVMPHETTISCSPTHKNWTAVCTTFFPGPAATSNFDGPSMWALFNTESSAYLAYFTSTRPFPEASTTAAASSTTSGPAASPGPSTGPAPLSRLAAVGIGIGASLGFCACVLTGALLRLGHSRRKRELRAGDADAGAGCGGGGGDSGDGMVAAVGDGDGGEGRVAELHGAEVGGCRDELEGSGAEGRGELA